MLRLMRQALALLVLPILLAGTAGGASSVLFTCKFTKVASSECCCHGASDFDTNTHLSRGSCCDVNTIDTALPLASVSTASALPIPSAAILVSALPPPAARRDFYAQSRRSRDAKHEAQPRAGPSLVILHRRILI